MLLFELRAKLNHKISSDDREACIPAVRHMADLYRLARREGVLALPSAVESETDVFLTEAVELMCEGYKNEVLERTFMYMILAENNSGVDLMRQFLIAEGLLAIYNGEESVSELEIKLAAMLGPAVLEQMRTEEESATKISTLEQFYAKVSDKKTHKDFTEFEAMLMDLPDEKVRTALESISEWDINYAMEVLGCDAIHKIMDNLSHEKYATIFKYCHDTFSIMFQCIRATEAIRSALWDEI